MKNDVCFFIFMLVFVFNGCKHREDISNRIYFTFHPEDQKIVIPVKMNDSINLRLLFDTGSGRGYYYMRILLDSSILITQPNLLSNQTSASKIEFAGSAWNKKAEKAMEYDSELKIEVGNTDFAYAGLQIIDWKKLMNNNFSDGLFNIPRNDTSHIWELNFDHNYVEVHSADDYVLPADCWRLPLVGGNYYPFLIDLPLQIKFDGNDTLSINQRFVIDTGVPWDIVLLHRAEELKFLNKREDAVWIKFLDSYVRYYTGNATVFGNKNMDSLRVYTIDYQNRIDFTNYIIGLNFLKRFNVFFDMKNKQLGLQPIKNFQRLTNSLFERFHYSTLKTRNGKYIVNKLGDYEENYYKTAGLRIRDEIVSINGIPYGDTTREIRDSLKKQDTLTLEIIRSGKPLTLSVPIDPNEPKGD